MLRYQRFAPKEYFGCNTYLLSSGSSSCVIDASVPLGEILPQARRPIAFVLLTHGHFDHICALSSYAEAGIPVMICAQDLPQLTDPYANASLLFYGKGIVSPCGAAPLADGQVLRFGEDPIRVSLTPGHTPGSACFQTGGLLLTGDTLFSGGGYGRCDLPGGNVSEMRESLERLRALPPDLRILPGHGEEDLLASSLSRLLL